ncbi:MAG: DEAD/DEAH box helicase [Methanobrevibacter sp.]|nr:DEAD/DEAH box helicase [Candidatus Methanovirga australis]
MSKNSYNYLSKTMKEFLSFLGWKKLNSIQNEAIPLIMDKKDTLIISPTASGKTEAVLIPIFESIRKKRLKPISVLYVAPLKALINDMHNRIETWGKNFGLTAFKWHGDVNKSQKDSFLRNPDDFLAITPESLEVILMNKDLKTKKRLLQNIEYIVVDEIHYFAGSDRGVQLNSLLNRITKYTTNKITKIGLSATVGNPEKVAKWINHEKNPAIVRNSDTRDFYYKVFYYEDYTDKNKRDTNKLDNKHDDIEDSGKILVNLLKKYTDKKVLIFSMSREGVEKIFNTLKNFKKQKIFLHHSSINKTSRESAEKEFKTLKNGFMVSSSTLELGIDIGNIAIVFQINSPKNISSFLQRVGRSGRRSKKQRSIILTSQWDILFTLAQIALIKEEQIEDLVISTKSKDIYFHQILSSVFEVKKIKQKDLFDYLKDAYVFSDISEDDFKLMIKNMVERNFLDLNSGFLSLGYKFEEKYGRRNFMEFFTVFCPSYEFRVLEGKKEVGTLDPSISMKLTVGEKFVLAGSHWNVKSINHEKFYIQVVKSLEAKVPKWYSDGLSINSLISEKVYDLITGDHDSALLKTFDNKTKKIINTVIKIAEDKGFEKGFIPIEIDNDSRKVFIYTFAGNKANILLSTIFKLHYDIYEVKDTPFYSSFKIKRDDAENISFLDIKQILDLVEDILNREETFDSINEIVGKFYKNKFINYLPYEDQVNLKMDIIFDKDGLINVIKNKIPTQVFDVNFDKWIEYDENELFDIENSNIKSDNIKNRSIENINDTYLN